MSVIYLYGFVPKGTALPEDGLLGVDDAEVDCVDGPGFDAAIGRVDPAEFTDPALERNTANIDWMAEQGLAHEQVVAWFVDHAAILPSRLMTLFSGEPALRETMAAEADRIRAQLDRFGTLREWDLRVGYDAERLMAHLGEVSEAVGRLDREMEEAAPGRRFLLEKKRQDLARTEGRSTARRLAGELLDALRTHATDTVTLEPPTEGAPATLNAALLVERDEEAALIGHVAEERDRLGSVGLTVHLTGPWAPYRFMGRDE